ncbi:MAG: sigma-70 family RNA polymerase sigma factor [Myxococcales bacterium]|nr:sigma-70 family RNA polymerase sigma factor [Myxococcales bacterium]
MPQEPPDITGWLGALNDPATRDAAVEHLWPVLYEDLKRRAGRAMRRERAQHTLQPTALVHEAFLRMVRAKPVAWEDRAHFLAIAARVMRQVLVDHARKRDAVRRGGDQTRVTLDELRVGARASDTDLIDLHTALQRLEGIDVRSAQIAELKLFGGCTAGEISEALDVSVRTVESDWATARMWLSRALSESVE